MQAQTYVDTNTQIHICCREQKSAGQQDLLLPFVEHGSGLIFNDITKLRGEGEIERGVESLVLHHPMLSKICFHKLVLCEV